MDYYHHIVNKLCNKHFSDTSKLLKSYIFGFIQSTSANKNRASFKFYRWQISGSFANGDVHNKNQVTGSTLVQVVNLEEGSMPCALWSFPSHTRIDKTYLYHMLMMYTEYWDQKTSFGAVLGCHFWLVFIGFAFAFIYIV